MLLLKMISFIQKTKFLILGGRPKIQKQKIKIKNTLVLIYGPYSKKILAEYYFFKIVNTLNLRVYLIF